MRLIERLASFLSLLIVVAVIAGCGSKVNQDNFEKIKAGMTYEEVKGILGPPTEDAGGGIPALTANSRVWKDGDKSITVMFVNDKVQGVPVKSGF